MKSSSSLAGAMLLSAFTSLFVAGCAQNPDVRDGHDYTSGTTAKARRLTWGVCKVNFKVM